MRLIPLLVLLAAPAAFGAETPGKTAGANTAPLTIEVYSDFECPQCKVFHQGNLQSLIRDYVVPGKAYLIHREFPLPQHKYARTAALWATAAARIGKYDEVAGALFARVQEWSVNGKVAEAASAALSPEQAKKVRALAADPAIAAEVQREQQTGAASGVNRTPSVIVTRKLKRIPLPDVSNYSFLRRLLDDLLKQ